MLSIKRQLKADFRRQAPGPNSGPSGPNSGPSRLWKLLIDKDMKKKDLRAATKISSASMAKLGKNENVTTDVLVRICDALGCELSDIMELQTVKKVDIPSSEDKNIKIRG